MPRVLAVHPGPGGSYFVCGQMPNGWTSLPVDWEAGAAEAAAGAATPAPAITAASNSAAPIFFIFTPKLNGLIKTREV